MLEDGYCVGMFPQGTRRAGVDPETTPIKAGAGLIASKAKASVLPIHIKTKNYKIKAFRKVKLIIGDPIPYEEYTKGGELEGDSRAITQYIFDRICELGREEEK
jgi:1-acyl-sn-glycerol-3-phosphate acyltransferase